MTTQRILSKVFVAAASFSVLAACSPTETPTTPGTPSAEPTASTAPSTAPSASAMPSADPSASAMPSADPSASAMPSANPSASAMPSADPSATASPSATLAPSEGDISVIERTTFNGKVYDDTNAPLDGVTVTAKSLNSSVAYEVSTVTAGGTYAFNNAPAGVQLEITASRNGYTTRRRVEVLKSNKQGDPDANRYDFGVASSNSTGFGTEFNALSDKPEVTMVTPGRNASGINPGTSFVLRFSEPMDRQTVVDAFQIHAFGTSETLSVDDETTFNAASASNGNISGTSGNNGSLVWDKSAFNASWNSDDTEVTMTFKEERMLPTDTDSDNVPDYAVTFEGGTAGLKDKSGITRDEDHFKLTEGQFEDYYKFSINTDEDKPTVESITVVDGGNSGTSNGDTIKVRFSERMIHRTLAGPVAGGVNDVANEAAGAVTDSGNTGVTGAQAGANYQISINGGSNADWSTVAGGTGEAVFDSNDATNKTVLLFTSSSSDAVFSPGQNIEITVKTTVLDPAGNSVDSSDNDASAVAG